MCTVGSVTTRTRPDLQQGIPYWFSLADGFYIDLSVSNFQDSGYLVCARMLHKLDTLERVMPLSFS